jgi:hypothetical protein
MTDMESIDRRLDLLESENRALRAEIAELRGHPKPPPPATPIRTHREPQVSITEQSPAIYPMPTPDEMTQLIDAVGKRFPALLCTEGAAFEGTRHERREQWRRQFVASFEAIGCMKRTERPDTKLYLSAHVQIAETILKGFGRPSMTIRNLPFLAAALAHFDVPISGIGGTHEGIVVDGLNQ